MLQCILGATNQMFRGDPFVTIVEIHMTSVCAYIYIFWKFLFFDHLDFIEKAKIDVLYNDRAAITHKINLTQKLCSIGGQTTVKCRLC